MKKLKVLAPAFLLVLSGCGQNAGSNSERRVDSDRRVDLEGRGVVTYKAKRPDIADGGSEDGKIVEVKAIRFYENYIVVEKSDGASKVLTADGLITFEWRK